MFSLTYLPQKHKFRVFTFILGKTEMAQNNSLFVWKFSNYSCGRSNLRNDMNQQKQAPEVFFKERCCLRPATLFKKRLWQRCFPVNFVKFLRALFSQNTSWRLLLNQVTNLKSLGFTQEITANLLGVFPEVVSCKTDFSGFFNDAFDPHISSIVRFLVDCVAKLVLFVSVAEADDSPAPTLRRSSMLSPLLLLPLILGNNLPDSCVTDGCWISFISHFAMFTKSISDSTILFVHSHYSSF